ncbi:MAG TPA: YkvA family protein [Nocardioidaceae bacterium]|nr:YkvA family protein [Nocardioidaceae bacterium]
MWWTTLLGILTGLVLVYLVLFGLLWRYAHRHPDTATLRDALRLLPDLIRLLRRLAADSGLPRSVRIRLGLLLIYLASPIDLVPDFIPVVGYADDAIVVALVLRAVVRRAGPDAVSRHWPGTPQGLAIIRRLAGAPTDN